MDKQKTVKNLGYTLVELMMTMAILSVISAIAIPNYTRYLASARERACITDRQTILLEYHLYYAENSQISLTDYMKVYFTGEEAYECPNEGTYTFSGSGDTAEIICSIHHTSIKEPNSVSTQNTKELTEQRNDILE